MTELSFQGRVAIITGAGGGLGRTYAHLLASRGASIVVNDLGVTRSGSGHSSNAADVVVSEIVKSGGKAVANYDSVEDGDKIVACALKAFGRIDIVINNAGILRDKSFAKMSDEDWDLVYRVHVRGSYKVTKAAWPHLMKQKYGRIIMTSSAAGIYGNYGQANYSAAKAALASFGFTLAREGARNNVYTNIIAPLAASRMTESVLPPELLAALKPEFVAPVVGWLCHEKSEENGGLFELGAGYVGKLRWERSKGVLLKTDESLTPAAVGAKIEEAMNFKNVEYPTAITDTDWVGLAEKARELKRNESREVMRFDGRVVIVTGAGAGIGRCYALMFGRLGASVVVNDLGVSTTGQGSSSRAADKVVEEIKGFGGKAVANYDSVEEGEKIVDTAIKAFGRVDVVINNAGILRDKSFMRMSDEDWDLVQRVHVRGSFKVAKAAWPFMIKQKYGRIVNTASAVGLYGNFGQANYSAAKLALVGMSNTLAQEGNRFNIKVNTVAPNAGTRMTATILPPEIVEALKPDFVAPFVGYLANEKNEVSGGVFEVGSGWISRVRWQRSRGVAFPIRNGFSIEQVASKWKEIVDFKSVDYPTNPTESLSMMISSVENVIKPSDKTDDKAIEKTTVKSVNVEEIRKVELPIFDYKLNQEIVILYNLSVGAKRKDLKYTFELSDGFSAVPSIGVIPGFLSSFSVPLDKYLPPFNPMMLLHGEQYLEIVGNVPIKGEMKSQSKIVDVVDKGKATAVLIKTITKDENGNVLFVSESTSYILGLTKLNVGKKWSVERPLAAISDNHPPQRSPDFVSKDFIPETQADLYRLLVDKNPLHVDPLMSSLAGFDQPILHGLCTFGYSTRMILEAFNLNSNEIKSIKVRFNKHVFPGETIQTEMWKVENKIIFQVKVLERNVFAITNAAIELKDSSFPKLIASFSSFKSIPLLQSFKLNSDLAKLKSSFQFDIIDNYGCVFPVSLILNSNPCFSLSQVNNPDLTIRVYDDDFVDLLSGKYSPQIALFNSKIKLAGDFTAIAKLEKVFKLLKNTAKL
ncbi:NAD(P)-binding protein [Rozella allomycis CSF55]|uniref:Peroxisomal hydratase-dehydrogenase-epimerase n=1 Tax=Rozella allomycis (strain CSF55) TaxID=988480 RepID=A0A4P9YMY7_ROZAC|nr:NAD(P)-binding protein [Rozella allomycis CSF55]